MISVGNKELAIGYLKCMECSRPALFLFDRNNYTRKTEDEMQLQVKYSLLNVNRKDYDSEKLGYYLCDSCGGRISQYNYAKEFLVFLDEDEYTLIIQ